MKFKFLLLSLLLSTGSFATEKTVIRLGVQTGGTVEWELPALQDELNANPADFQLDIKHVANAEAGEDCIARWRGGYHRCRLDLGVRLA